MEKKNFNQLQNIAHRRSMKILSISRPFPSILILMPLSFKTFGVILLRIKISTTPSVAAMYAAS